MALIAMLLFLVVWYDYAVSKDPSPQTSDVRQSYRGGDGGGALP